MKRLACILFVLAFLVCGLGTARASNILYFVDCLSGTDAMALALAGSGHSVTTVGSSADFATQIGGGGYDLGVFMVQGSSSSNYGDGITALGSFVASGGRAIYTDWSIDNTYAALFDAAWSEPGWDYENYSQFTITDPLLGAGITNPVQLYNPGWGTFSMGLAGNVFGADFSDSGAIALGFGGRTIVNGFLTDTFTDTNVGTQLYLNEIEYALGPSGQVPVPGAIWLLGSGFLGLVGLRKKFKS